MTVKGAGETMITDPRWKIVRGVGNFSPYQHEVGVSPARSKDPPSHSPADLITVNPKEMIVSVKQ